MGCKHPLPFKTYPASTSEQIFNILLSKCSFWCYSSLQLEFRFQFIRNPRMIPRFRKIEVFSSNKGWISIFFFFLLLKKIKRFKKTIFTFQRNFRFEVTWSQTRDFSLILICMLLSLLCGSKANANTLVG